MSKCIICNDEIPEGEQVCGVCKGAPLYKNPCKGVCVYRTPTCHATCKRYLTWAKYRANLNDHKHKQNIIYRGKRK